MSIRLVELTVDDKLVSMMIVGCATHQSTRFAGVEYIRIGSYKKQLKDHPDKAGQLWRSFDATPFEEQVAADRVDVADVLDLLDYPAYFRLLKLPLPEERAGILARLQEDGLIRDRTGGRWDITKVGAILFAADLTSFPDLSRKAVRVVQYDGDSRIKTKRERPIAKPKGYAAEFEALIEYIKAVLPENEVIGAAFRKAVPMYPELAIRELVPNALIHQDFAVGGTGPMIEIFDDRLEITNPGTPLVDPQRFLDLPPRSRNETLASFMRRVDICEERGSGVDKVVFQTEFYQLPAPLFEVVGGHTRAVLFAHQPFGEMSRDDQRRACYLHACLQSVRMKRLTNASLRERFGVDADQRSKVSRIITDTADAGLIKPYDKSGSAGKYASYVPFWA